MKAEPHERPVKQEQEREAGGGAKPEAQGHPLKQGGEQQQKQELAAGGGARTAAGEPRSTLLKYYLCRRTYCACVQRAALSRFLSLPPHPLCL